MLNENRGSPPGAIPHRFIVIEGPIGVGKTSLARLLAQSIGAQLILEEADQNPFLERFYKNPRAAAFQTQLFFLFQRARQLEDVRQEDLFGAVRVADYRLLLAEISKKRRGRHFFNPSGTSLLPAS